MKPKHKLLYFVPLLLLASCGEETGEKVDLAITNAQVIHLESGAIKLQDVYLSDGRIKAVLAAGSPSGYTPDSLIDGSGKYLLPGFWDNHIHLRGGDSLIANNRDFLNLFLANGITTIRDAGGDLAPSVMDWRARIAKEEIPGPDILTAGPKIDGPNASWAGSLEVATGEEVEAALDSLERLEVDFVKLYDSRISAENYLRAIQGAQQRNMLVSGHMPFSVTLEEALTAGMDAVEHLYYILKGCSSEEASVTQKVGDGSLGFWDAMPILRATYSPERAATTFGLLREKGVFVVPTLHIGRTLSHLDQVDHGGDPYLKYMGRGILKTYEGRIKGALNAPEAAREERRKLDTFFGQLAKALDSAGVKLLAGSDSGAFNSYVYPGISLHRELEAMVEVGISPLDALRSSAPNGAEFMGRSEAYGAISQGMVSDLVLLDANPLEDISNTQRIHCVIKGSQLLPKARLAQLLEDAVKE